MPNTDRSAIFTYRLEYFFIRRKSVYFVYVISISNISLIRSCPSQQFMYSLVSVRIMFPCRRILITKNRYIMQKTCFHITVCYCNSTRIIIWIYGWQCHRSILRHCRLTDIKLYLTPTQIAHPTPGCVKDDLLWRPLLNIYKQFARITFLPASICILVIPVIKLIHLQLFTVIIFMVVRQRIRRPDLIYSYVISRNILRKSCLIPHLRRKLGFLWKLLHITRRIIDYPECLRRFRFICNYLIGCSYTWPCVFYGIRP